MKIQCLCGNHFDVPDRPAESSGRRPSKCPACRAATKKKSWAGRRARLRRITDGMSGGKKKSFMTFATIGYALALNRMTVHQAYRQALLKLRENGGEILREVLQREGLNGLMEVLRAQAKPGDVGIKLLEYQMKVIPLWQTHDNLVTLQMPAEAVKVRCEIERFQTALESELKSFLAN